MNHTSQSSIVLAAATALVGQACTQEDPDTAFGGAQTSSSPTGGGRDPTAADTDGRTTGDGSSAGASGGSSGEFKFDLGSPDAGSVTDPCNAYSYIWIADSAQNAVSKVNTQSMVEEGRYRVHPGEGDPSRTSVSLSGDVAIANRSGGVTKVYAHEEDCVESNGMPGIQTSSGADDVLEWGLEECIAWHVPMAYTTQRPVAWSPGEPNPDVQCAYTGETVWTTGAMIGTPGSVVTTVLDGDTGAIVQEIPMPEIEIGSYGPYGAAFDSEGNYWFIDSGNDGPEQELVRVNPDDYAYDIWITPPGQSPYGFALDTNGRPWISGTGTGILRFDPDTESFDLIEDIQGLGMQQDGAGRMWISAHGELDLSGGFPLPWEGVNAFDIETMELVQKLQLPAAGARGVSIDFEGNVWVVDIQTAFRVDPATETHERYDGLDGPYTYSDMTGWGLANVTQPEG